MDQKFLHSFEEKCIEEEQPFCQAACPFHLDAREFNLQIKNNNLAKAVSLLAVLPLSGLFIHLCEAPCKNKCRRGENLGGPLNMPFLEQYVFKNGPQIKAPLKMPVKNKTVFIYGNNLAALISAWELGRRGYKVIIIIKEQTLAPFLSKIKNLTADLITNELNKLFQFDVTVQNNITFNFLDKNIQNPEENTAVFWAETILEPANKVFNPLTLELKEGLFGGVLENDFFYIQADKGRRAAISLERHFQKASLSLKRENEGSKNSKLYTNLNNIIAQQQVKAQNINFYNLAETQKEAQRCLNCHCLECVKNCQYLKSYGAYPKKYTREIYNNLALVEGVRSASQMIFSCTLCGLCKKLCPTGFDMPLLITTARRIMAKRKLTAQAVYEYALSDFNQALSEEAFLFKKAPHNQPTKYIFFPSCQLGANSPFQVQESYNFLLKTFNNEVGLFLSCCGIFWEWIGEDELLKKHISNLKKSLNKAKQAIIIVACSACQAFFKKYLPEFKTKFLWEVFLENDIEPFMAKQKQNTKLIYNIHDSCLAASDKQQLANIRKLCNKLNIKTKDITLSNNLSSCCGFGGLAQGANPKLIKEYTLNRIKQFKNPIINYCAMCQDRFQNYNAESSYILDFIFPPKTKKRINPSERQENRKMLKDNLMKKHWPDEYKKLPEKPWATLNLIIKPEILEILNERRILINDLKETLYLAEKEKNVLLNTETNECLAVAKPKNVTFWLKYYKNENEYIILNTWSHRMVLPNFKNRAENDK